MKHLLKRKATAYIGSNDGVHYVISRTPEGTGAVNPTPLLRAPTQVTIAILVSQGCLVRVDNDVIIADH